VRIIEAAALAIGLAVLVAAGAAQGFGADSLVARKCIGCHPRNADGRVSRVEDMRTTPEEWTVVVDRMRRLHGMPLTRDEMDGLLKELATTQLLAPDEQASVAYLSLWHNAQQVESPSGKDDERMFAACVRCHTAGKIRSYRMTPEAWAKQRDFHLYAIPTVVAQMREMHWIEEADAVLAYLARALPYGRAWIAPAAKPEGDWAVFAHRPGHGPYRGEVRIESAGNAEYKLSGSHRYADAVETFAGEATLYGGYALRTRMQAGGAAVFGAYRLDRDEIRGEVHFPAPDFRTSTAIWLRKTGTPRVARVVPAYLLRDETTTLLVEGVDLPDVSPADIAFSGGPVRVLGARRVAPEAIEITVASGATKLVDATLRVKGIDAGAVRLAPRIDSIVITPSIGRARLAGSRHHPPEGVQFEAIAYAKAPAAKAAVALGPVPATFRLAEHRTRPGDDDLRWLGEIKPNGTYVPTGGYGPNEARRFRLEDSGLVNVLAEYRRGQRTYRAQAKLAVTMPDYIARIR
jgi:hypothetical protein